jgi:F0F1-type ATP synthase assembly protein I
MAGATEPSHWNDLGAAWNAVAELVAATGLYGVLGWFADKWLGTGHVLFLIGLVGGNMLGVYLLYKRSVHAESQLPARGGHAHR